MKVLRDTLVRHSCLHVFKYAYLIIYIDVVAGILYNIYLTKFQTQHVTTTPVKMAGFAQKQTQDMSVDVHGVAVLMTWQELIVKLVRRIYSI